ncbi:hypothetical protein PYW07_006857 [Mythimna separata]|uniref:Immunoglobulin-binding protein 1 n=1 Tax=Mythimna separata TaxID=271217 RepID=A0AAD8DZI7_MYTSE|nr:hypothetical protein PYW07_006857 [Mythimna separata]
MTTCGKNLTDAGQSTDEEPLKKIFEDGMKMFDNIEKSNEPTNSDGVQLSIKSAIAKFEKATNLVSLTGMFSKNEGLEELPTETLQYMLLPALLGSLTLKLCNQRRKEIVTVAEIYFKDFLQRCKDYGVTDLEVPQTNTESNTIEKVQTEQAKIASLVLTREAKIKRFKEAQDLKEQLSILSKAMESSSDDETKRAYFLKLLQSYINQSFEELSSIEQEKIILDYMSKNAGAPASKEPRPHVPLKPVIITRDAVQKAVFGLGYPAIPALTVEEFYDQRVRDGIRPCSGSATPPSPRSLSRSSTTSGSGTASPKSKEPRPHVPLKPVIITRDAVQKAVFGLGYPAIPALTVEEFYDQRVRDGIRPCSGSATPPSPRSLSRSSTTSGSGTASPKSKEPRPHVPLKPVIITRDAVQKAVFGLGYPAIPALTVEEFYDQREPRPHVPLKPVIITRDAVQKAVFGLGYPAIPALTVEEFYDQRVRDGIFPGTTNIPHTTIQSTENDADEEEKIRKERLVEEDDPEERARQNNMDEYKDEHRRGWGNRYNRS